MKFIKTILISAVCCASAALTAAAQDASAPSLEEFSIIYQRNIFDRSRRPPSAPVVRVDPPPRPQPEPPRTERNFVLRGTAREGAERYVAFVENTRDNTSRTLRVGDSVAEGKVVEITLDSVTYESDRGTARIGVGSNFEGAAVAASRPASTGTSGLSERELLERLRARREQELGRGAPQRPAPEQPETPATAEEPSAPSEPDPAARHDEGEIEDEDAPPVNGADDMNSVEHDNEEN